jgi:hypothetical protein
MGRFFRLPQDSVREIVTERAGVRFDPNLIGGAAGPPPPQKVIVADNSDFIDRVNARELIGILIRPTRTVVVAQSPAPGDQVPLGTPVTLTLTVKDILPLPILGVDPVVSGKFATVGALQNAIDANTSADALKQVLAKKQSYQDLSQGDKAVADGFLGQLGDLSDQDKQKAFGDVSFAFNL